MVPGGDPAERDSSWGALKCSYIVSGWDKYEYYTEKEIEIS